MVWKYWPEICEFAKNLASNVGTSGSGKVDPSKKVSPPSSIQVLKTPLEIQLEKDAVKIKEFLADTSLPTNSRVKEQSLLPVQLKDHLRSYIKKESAEFPL